MKKIFKFAVVALAAAAVVVACQKPATENKDGEQQEEQKQDEQKQDETPAEDPAPAGTWSLIGTFGGHNWDFDVNLTANGDIYSVSGVELTTADQFKLRLDGAWDTNRGAEGEVEPFAVTIGEALHVVNNGKNLSVPEDGTYTITFDRLKNTITLSK